MSWRPDVRLLGLALQAMAGRRFWLLALLPLLWLAFQAGVLLLGAREGFEPHAAQGVLIGAPLTVLAVFLGMRIIAGEIDGRTLEIAYTVPGGCERVWWTRLRASVLVLIAAEALLAVFTYVFFVPFPWDTLYGAMQAALFYLVLSMGMATLFRSEAAGAMVMAAILALNGVITGFGDNQVRISPFWNPHAIENADPTELLAWNLQNRIGIPLVMTAILALTFMRANRRERMLGG